MAKGGRPKTCSSPISAGDFRAKGESESENVIHPVPGRRNSDLRGFTNPTLSSLSKSKPVAVIRAYDEVADHKNLIEKSKVLEKLRSTQIRSPLLDQRRQELENLLQTKSHEVIRNELSTIVKESQTFEHELQARHGDASYRFDIAKCCNTLDETTRTKAVQNFTANSDDRFRLVHELEVNVRRWTDTIIGSKRILKALQSDPVATEVGHLIEEIEQDMERHLKSCFAWSAKISNINVQVMCRYFDDLSFNTISNVCVCHQDLAKIISKHDMNNSAVITNEFGVMAEFLAEESPCQFHCLFPESSSSSSKKVTFAPASSCCDLFPEHSTHETEGASSGMSFENVLNIIILRNQRILLRMMFARYTPDERKPKKKSSPRKTWKINDYVIRDKQTCFHNHYRQLDETFWNLFWNHFTGPLVHVFTAHDITDWPPLLHEIRNTCLSINELSHSALTSLSKAYTQLFRVYSEHIWSVYHRKMIQAMDRCDVQNSTTFLTDDQLSTSIGCYAQCAVDPIVLMIRECESDGNESLHCLTLSINTLINWINCENMNDWPIVTAVILVWGDLERLCSSLKSLGDDEKLAHFEQDVREVQVLNIKCILGRVSHESRLIVKRNMPRSRYKSRVCRTSSTWMLECFRETVGQLLGTVNKFSMPGVEFLDAFLGGCLAELVQDPLKFSHSGAKGFANDAEALVTHVREVTHHHEADLLQYEQINDFLNFCRFITSGSPSAASSFGTGNKITPADLMQFRESHHSTNCFDCCL